LRRSANFAIGFFISSTILFTKSIDLSFELLALGAFSALADFFIEEVLGDGLKKVAALCLVDFTSALTLTEVLLLFGFASLPLGEGDILTLFF
jgi:hypothetical protein